MRDTSDKNGKNTNVPRAGELTRRLAEQAQASEKSVTTPGSGVSKTEAFLTSFANHFRGTMMDDGILGTKAEFQLNPPDRDSQSIKSKSKSDLCRDMEEKLTRFRETYKALDGTSRLQPDRILLCRDFKDVLIRFQTEYAKLIRPQSDSLPKPQDGETQTAKKSVKDQLSEANQAPERIDVSKDTPLAKFLEGYKAYKAREEQTKGTSDQPEEATEAPEQTKASQDTPLRALARLYEKRKDQESRKERTKGTSETQTGDGPNSDKAPEDRK